MSINIRIPYGQSVHGKEEIKAVTQVLKHSTQMGKNVQQFERKISKLFSKKYGLMVNSGSSAILLAMEALNLPKNSEIITPALTFSSTVSYIVKNNLVPVFVDVKKGTYCMDEEKVERLINKNTKAIIAPHLIGNLVNWEKIYKKLKKKNIIIISCLVLVAVLVAGYFTYKRMGITMNKVHLGCDNKEGHETTLNFELDFSKSTITTESGTPQAMDFNEKAIRTVMSDTKNNITTLLVVRIFRISGEMNIEHYVLTDENEYEKFHKLSVEATSKALLEKEEKKSVDVETVISMIHILNKHFEPQFNGEYICKKFSGKQKF